MGTVFDFFSKVKSTLIGLGIISIIAYCGFYVYGLKSTISNLTVDKSNLTLSLSEANKTIAIKEAKIAVLEGTVNELSGKIEDQNINIKNMMIDNTKLNQDIMKLQHQEPSIQYIVKTKDISCDDLKSLVKKIGGLKYENF